MATRGVQFVAYYGAWNTSNNDWETGDSGNHSLQWVKDGTDAAATNAPAEIDAVNSPGQYKVTITATEADCLSGQINGVSSTADVIVIPTSYAFEYIPNAVPGAAGGMFIAGSNAATTVASLTSTGALTAGSIVNNGVTTLTGNVSLGGTLGVTGTTTLAAVTTGNVTFNALTVTTTTTLTGNVSLGGTLGVTGTTTLAAVTTTGTVTMNALTVSNATTLTGNVSLGGTLGVAGATTLATLTVTGAFTADGVDIPAALTDIYADVPGLVWDVLIAGHLNVGSTGEALNAAGAAGDPWVTALPGAYGAGSAGFIVGNNLNAAVSLVPAAVWAVALNGALTAAELTRGVAAATMGKVSGLPGSPVFRDPSDTKNVIVATTDADGNRITVTYDLTP